jgi:uncharacterized membrane protein YdfJ with MMPL/SSD domain
VRSFGHYAYVWRGRILLLAALVAIAAAFAGSSIFDQVKPYGFEDPDSESTQATRALEQASGERPLPDVVLLVAPRSGSREAVAGAAARAERELGTNGAVTRVVGPSDDLRLSSVDGEQALVLGYLAADTEDIAEVGEQVEAQFEQRPEVIPGGAALTAHQLNQTTEEDLRRIELFAAPLLFLLCFLVFRGLVAATLPLVVGVLSIVFTLLSLRLLTEVMDVDVFAINVVTALGLGLAIDYSLFVVSRYREELERHGPGGEALRATMGAVGPMVVFSGLTVALALASLTVFPQRFLYSMGIGGSLVAVLSAAVVLVVLPALLAVLGERVNALAPPELQRARSTGRWYGLAKRVMRNPLPVATLVAVAMIAAGLPFLRAELTRADSRVLPEDASSRQVDAAIRSGFEANPSDQMLVVLGGDDAEGADAAGQGLARHGAIGAASNPQPVGELLRVDLGLDAPPYSDSALDAVDDARGADWGSEPRVSGRSAELVDQRESLDAHLPLAIAITVISSMLVLFVMTRSVVLPVVSLLMNALTVSVAFGALVLIFQDGRFEGALDYMSYMALDTSMPILLFALAFGLSTDYGVFLLQRISEARADGLDDTEAIAVGLDRSGRIITAAALLFAVAMGAFVFSELIFLKEVAVGTAIAVLVDATVVRALLFPSVLALLGTRAWWAPAALRRDA